MILENDLTEGKLFPKMMNFAIPYLLACFLQTFYGLADLFITGQFYGAAPVSAVFIGSQVMHMVIVMITGLTIGCAVSIARSLGGRDEKNAYRLMGTSAAFFIPLSFLVSILLLLLMPWILSLLQTPPEALEDTADYLFICFLGVPLIFSYNMMSSFLRGMGNTRAPMIFVALSGIVNIGLDYLLIGPFHMSAKGAAIGTVGAEILSVLLCLFYLYHKAKILHVRKKDFYFSKDSIRQILGIGFPICCQDGLIQVSFLAITSIADSLGVETAASVGIVEKIIGFLFLVPSAMMSTVSATTAQNAGAGFHERGKMGLTYGITTCISFGFLCILLALFKAQEIIGLFVPGEEKVIAMGSDYFHAYCFDCAIAGIHFCFSGYFSACRKATLSFIHNVISTFAIRIPGAYLAARLFPATLFPMGLATPAGSLLSVFICIYFYRKYFCSSKAS